MTSKAEQQFNEDYLYVRRELIRGKNPFVTTQSMKDWIRTRVDQVVEAMAKEREQRMKRNVDAHPDLETEWYEEDKRRRGEKDDDDE
jgi:hypothetical protein